jgi:hypothetical protein
MVDGRERAEGEIPAPADGAADAGIRRDHR